MIFSKKTSTYITIGVFFMLNGIEYAVLFPTVWLYLRKRLEAPAYMMGVVVASFSVSGMFASPLIGKWADVTRNTKFILLFANMWEIAGNIMYMMGISAWFIVASRLVCGLGAGSGAAVVADISRGTSERERTTVLSMVMGAWQFGLLIGPAFNLFLREFNFYIGPLLIDVYTAPGLFLTVVWCLHQLQVILMYWNLEALRQADEVIATDNNHVTLDSNEGTTEHQAASLRNGVDVEPGTEQQIEGTDRQSIEDREQQSTADTERETEGEEREIDSPVTVTRSTDTSGGRQQNMSSVYINAFVREETILLLFLLFITFFNQVALETIVTPLTDKLFNWTALENSLLYSAASIQILVVYVCVSALSRLTSDLTLIVIGLSLELVGMLWCLVVVPDAHPGQRHLLVYLGVGVAILLSGLPLLSTAGISLYSKCMHYDLQGVGHGVRRSVTTLAMIMGPLWGGSMLHRLRELFIVNIVLLLILMSMTALSYKRLRMPTTQQSVRPGPEDNDQQKLSDNAATDTLDWNMCDMLEGNQQDVVLIL